jgi:hypothetical protein
VIAMHKKSEIGAFVSSCVYLVAMLCGAAADLYPILLPSTNPAMPSITIASAISNHHTLRVGLVWWTIGTMLAPLSAISNTSLLSTSNRRRFRNEYQRTLGFDLSAVESVLLQKEALSPIEGMKP